MLILTEETSTTGLLVGLAAAAIAGLVAALKIVLDHQSKKQVQEVPKLVSTGETLPEFWTKILGELQEGIDKTFQLLHDFTVGRDYQWDALNKELARITDNLHKLNNSVTIIRSKLKVPEQDDNG